MMKFQRLPLPRLDRARLTDGIRPIGADSWRRARLLLAGLMALAAGLALGIGSTRVAAQNVSAADLDAARLIVARAPGASAEQVAALHAAHGLQVVGGIPALSVDFLEPEPSVLARDPRLSAAVAGYEASPLVRWVELEDRWHVAGRDAIPNDPRYGAQWHLAKMNVPQAWDRARADSVVIAIVDTGVECTHPDLAASCVPGRNVIDGNTDTTDRNMHGTVESGAAAAVVDNGEGIAGVAWGAKIMPIKAMSDDGSGATGDIAAGIVWAADNGAHVINLSLGGEGRAQVMEDAVNHAVGKGAFLVASAGNMPTGNAMYPAAYDGVLGVGATTRADERPSFGNFGAHLDVCAPGVSILTTDLGGSYAPYDGTSESAALVSGIAALLLGQEPARTPAELRQLLIDTAVDLGPPGRDDDFGHGRVDAGAAIEAGAEDEPEPVDPQPNPCERGWTLSMKAFPDVSGRRGSGGWPPVAARCPGCDGVQSSADRRHGAFQPIGPLHVVISPAAEPAAVIAEFDMDGHGTPFGAPEHHISLCFPPPYRVTLATTAIDGYTLCSYSEAEVLLSQTNFDRARSSRRGQGRWAQVTWGFQRCSP